MKMNLTMKMVVYFMLVVLTAMVGFGFTIWKVDEASDLADNVNKVELPRLLKTNVVNNNVSDQIAALRGYYVYKDSQMVNDYKKLAMDNKNIEEELIGASIQPEAKRLISEVKALDDKYSEVAEKKFIPLVQAGKSDEALQTMAELAPLGKNLVAKINEYQNYRNKGISAALNQAVENAKQARTAAIFAAISAAILGILIGFFAARSIARPVNQLAAVAQKVAGGDLTEQIKVDRQDEIGQLATAFNTMIIQLKTLIKQINANAEQVAASSEELTASSEQSAQASNQIATSITDVATGANEQMAAANETSAVVEQMSAGVQQVAANANQVAAQSAQAADKARDGSKAVEKAVGQMTHIEETVNTSARVVAKLGERSKEIGQIVDTISGIAGQTNLLALNAAIEAARAGEQGRGFAVVAEEVRKLAEQSQEAAKKIAELIGEIQEDTDKAVVAMNDGTREVKTGSEVVNAAGTAFREIADLVIQVSGQVKEISAATQQMASGSQQIVDAVRKIDTLSKKSAGEAQSVSAATEEQLASMEEIATSSQALATLAQDLQAAVSRFRI
jgi:methyl-accepting chemotaxis protein